MAEYTGVRIIYVTKNEIDNLYTNKSLNSSTIDGRIGRYLNQNEFCILKVDDSTNQSAITRVIKDKLVLISNELSACGIKPRNKEQKMAMDALLDDNVPIVTLTGKAGSGKSILTIASAMQKIEEKKYKRIIMTRPMSQVGKYNLGMLPGQVSEKFEPYLQNYMCNISYIFGGNKRKRTVQDVIEQYEIEFIPIQLVRGASWMDTFIICDEMQVCGHDEVVTLGTRVGEGSKIVMMGDLGQRDDKIAKDKTGIHKLINDPKARNSELIAAIDLIKCERSKMAAIFAEIFER